METNKDNKPVLIDLGHVRIIRYNDLNVSIERLETLPAKNFRGEDIPEREEWVFKGYYDTKHSALQGILEQNLLDNEEDTINLERVLIDLQSMIQKAKKEFKNLAN